MNLFVLGFFFLFHFSQNPTGKNQIAKVVQSTRRVSEIKIDGKVSTQEWHYATLLHQFTELRPTPGRLEEEDAKTVSYLLYDDQGIYFGGICYESSREMISSELTGRDGFGNNDFVGIIFDTYKDNLNGFEYFVTPLNEQWDAKQTPNPNGNTEDFAWNSVWKSATYIGENYWSFELFIPFASIRFSEKRVQDWGLNIVRRRQKTGQQLFWNEINPNKNGFLTQEGYLTGLTDIKPPVRLQISPYVSYYANHYPVEGASHDFTSQFNGGMDLKWGINQAFTLDATLIPDFGQVQSDPQIFNLSPFEVRFDENRDFFTEGMELFNQGNLFYSRRIGGVPIDYGKASSETGINEQVVSNPSVTKLINASKVSGRTQHGLGVGVLNAMTNRTEAVLKDTLTGETRTIETAPLTNYNVFVLNQSLKNNSSVSFINTNVSRFGDVYDANVSGLTFDLNNAANTWMVGGQIFSSQILNVDSDDEIGYSHVIYGGKSSGELRFNVWQELSDSRYTSNDLGYFTNNNYLNHGLWIGLNKNQPNEWRNNLSLNMNVNFSRLFSPIGKNNPMFQSGRINVNGEIQTKQLHWIGGIVAADMHQNDYYEPRVEGRYFNRGASGLFGFWFGSNSAKTFSFQSDTYIRYYPDFYKGFMVEFNLNQNWRVNEKLSIRIGGSWMPRWNSIGFAGFDENQDDPVFGRREIQTFVSELRGKYNFTNRMGITLVARHYVSGLQNKELFLLNENGSLRAFDSSTSDYNRTVNFINLDMVYTWQFAQGSFVSIVWKYAVNRFDEQYRADYIRNLTDTFQSVQNNTVSMRVIYFLDYNQFRYKKW